MNIGNAVNKAANILKQNKNINPYLDTEILLSKVIKKDRKFIIINSKVNLKDHELVKFDNLILRRKKGEPNSISIK